MPRSLLFLLNLLFLLVLTSILMAETPIGPSWRVTDLQPVAIGDYLAPRWDIKGQFLWLTNAKFQDLCKIDSESRVTTVVNGEAIGYGWAQAWDGTILLKARSKNLRRLVMLCCNNKLTPMTDWTLPLSHPMRIGGVFFWTDSAGPHWMTPEQVPVPPLRTYFVDRDTLWVADSGGIERLPVPQDMQDRFYEVVPGADSWVVHGIKRGLYLLNIEDGKLTWLCAGTHPQWTQDNRIMVFDRTKDDGEKITSSELWAWDGKSLHKLEGVPELAQFPTLSTSGELAFEVHGTIYQGKVKW